MFSLILNVLRARRAQTVALFVLTVLAALGASAAPWFLGWAKDAVAIADIETAPAAQRVVVATGAVRYQAGAASPMTLLRESVRQNLDIPGASVVVGSQLYATMTQVGVVNPPEAGLYLNSRDDVCAQLRLVEGACPNAPGDVLIGRATAEAIDLHPGDQVKFEGFRLPSPAVLRVSGTYEVRNQLSPYWTGTDLLSGSAGGLSVVVDEAAYVSESTMLAAGPEGFDVDLHMYLPPDAYHGEGKDLVGTLLNSAAQLRRLNLGLTSQADQLVAQIAREQRLLTLGITVGAAQLVLLCWFVLFLALRHTSDERRPDIGLLKIRGAARWRIWSLTAWPSVLPMLAGAVAGWAIGFLAAGALSGDLPGLTRTADTDVRQTLLLSVAAAAAACVGALFAALLAESSALRAPVAALLRRIPGGRRTWRAEVGDLFFVVVAAAGIYQGYAELKASREPSLFALLAPGLVGLAVALLVARALPWLAGSAGSAALRAARPGAGLTALRLGRRPGTHRVFAVLGVCVCVFTSAMFFWQTATTGWAERAAQQLGAQQVLTVRAPNSTALLAAVRRVDPDGRFAMAAALTGGTDPGDRMLAVDSTRLAAVAVSPTGFGVSDMEALAASLRPPAPPKAAVGDGPITVDMQGPAELVPDAPMRLRLHLMSDAGRLTTVDFGPLGSARTTYTAEVGNCPQSSCRLVALEPVLMTVGATPAQSQLQIYDIAQPGHEIAGASMLADISRWSGPIGALGVGNQLTARDGHLTITPYTDELPSGQRRDYRVFALTTPVPVPLTLAGARPDEARAGDERFTMLGTDQVAYRVVRNTSVLPQLGANGGLVDLEYAQRSVSRTTEAAVLQVWLNAAAPTDTADRLSAAGVQVLATESIDTVADRLADQGPGMALRFQVFAAGIVLLLAAGTVLVTAAVERRGQVEELTALRQQGLSDRAMAIAGHGGTAVLVLGAVLTGLLSAVVAQAVVTTSMPIFADGWSLLPVPSGAQPWSLSLSIVVTVVVLGIAAVTGSARVVAAVRGAPGGRRHHPSGGGESS